MQSKEALTALFGRVAKTIVGLHYPALGAGVEVLEVIIEFFLPEQSGREKLFELLRNSLEPLVPRAQREAVLLEALRVVSECGDAPIAAGLAPEPKKYAEQALRRCGQGLDRVFRDQVRRVLAAFYGVVIEEGLLGKLVDGRTLTELAHHLGRRLGAVEEELTRLRHLLLLAPAFRLLTKPWALEPEPKLNFRALTAKYGVVPYHEPSVFSEVRDRVVRGSGLRVLSVVGPGGAGKTRLAIELAKRLSNEGWVAGFVPLGKDPGPLLELFRSELPWKPKGYLFVFDYAYALTWGSRIPDFVLGLVLEGTLDHDVPVAVLLLDRGDGKQLVDRLAQPFRTDSNPWNTPGLPDLAEQAKDVIHAPYALAELDEDGAQKLFKGAHKAFRERYPEETENAEDPAAAWGRLAGASGFLRRPLSVLIAAYLAVRGELGSPRGDPELLDQMLRFEGQRWRYAIEDSWFDFTALLTGLGRAVALATLLGGLQREEAEAACARLSPQNPVRLLELAARLLPAEGGGVAALEPGPLADRWLQVSGYGVQLEAFLGGETPPEDVRPPDNALTEALLAVFSLYKEDAGALGSRLARVDFVLTRAFGVHQAFLPFWERVLEGLALDPDALDRLLEAVLGSFVEERGLARLDPSHPLQASSLLVEVLKRRLSLGGLDEPEQDRARLLGLLGLQLSAMGQREEALKATEEATRLYRELAARNPEAFLPDLAMSVNNLGNRLSALGRREEALLATEEAVEIRRELAARNPEAFLPGLATSLNNLGVRLSALGRREEALEATEQAVQLYRELAARNPDAFLPNLARSLNNLGNRLSELGRREEALEVTEEAVEIRRELVKKNPEAFLPGLAGSLNNLGLMLTALGRHREALRATEEAVQIRRELVKKNREAFLPDLAESLNNLGAKFSILGRLEEGLNATSEAVLHYRELVKKNPEAFLPYLAGSVSNLGDDLSALGRREEVLEATKEAVKYYRELIKENPEAFLPGLAASLNNLGSIFFDVGRREEALKATEEAVQHYFELVAKNPETFLPDLARSLGLKSRILRALARYEEAAASSEEGLRKLQVHFLRYPQVFGGLISALLVDYLGALEELKREPDLDLICSLVAGLNALPSEVGLLIVTLCKAKDARE